MGVLTNLLSKLKLYFGKSEEDEPLRFSRWKVFGFVFFSALLTLLYVDNVFRVDGLLSDIQKIDKERYFLNNENEILRTKVNKLQSPERVTQIAREKLGMMQMDTPPVILEDKN